MIDASPSGVIALFGLSAPCREAGISERTYLCKKAKLGEAVAQLPRTVLVRDPLAISRGFEGLLPMLV